LKSRKKQRRNGKTLKPKAARKQKTEPALIVTEVALASLNKDKKKGRRKIDKEGEARKVIADVRKEEERVLRTKVQRKPCSKKTTEKGQKKKKKNGKKKVGQGEKLTF